MAEFQVNPGNGYFFENDKKGNQKAPDWKGKLVCEDGRVIQLSAWQKMTKSGKMMIAIKENIYTPNAQEYPREVTPNYKPDDNDNIPF